MKKYSIEKISDWDIEKLFSDWLNENYPEFIFNYASPYYDCETEDTIFYLSIVSDVDKETVKKALNFKLEETHFDLLRKLA